ncbi:MAG: hypothetical protein CPSOU_3119 [uncultured Paraburkholderia sp.]|nr:MAG: hypothetical protein CPSOU_3119 [uncultured Paraburkholderia sp.]
MDYYLVMQGVWLAIMMATSVAAAQVKGITEFPPDYATNNVSMHRLEQLLAQVV